MLNKKILTLLSSVLVLQHYLLCRFLLGRNRLLFGKYFFPLSSKIRVKGSDNSIIIGDDVKFKNTQIEIYGTNNIISIESGVRIYESCHFLIEGNNCTISLGLKTSIGSATIFCGESDTNILIGKDCLLGRSINIDTSDFHSIIDLNTNRRINFAKDVIIKDRVWIGFNVSINKGSTINSDSMVAIKSVVTGKEFPPNSIIAGIPAKVINHNIAWDINKLTY